LSRGKIKGLTNPHKNSAARRYFYILKLTNSHLQRSKIQQKLSPDNLLLILGNVLCFFIEAEALVGALAPQRLIHKPQTGAFLFSLLPISYSDPNKNIPVILTFAF